MDYCVLISALKKVVAKINYTNWRNLTDKEIAEEYEWEYSKVKEEWGDIFPTLRDFKEAVKKGKPEIVTKGSPSIDNRSYPDDIEDLKRMVQRYQYPRDVDRIIEGLKNNDPIPYPIVLQINSPNWRWIMSGNTRMAVSSLLGVTPKVLIVKNKEDEEVEEKAYFENVTVDSVVKELISMYGSLDDWWGQGEGEPEEKLISRVKNGMNNMDKSYRKLSFPLDIFRCLDLTSIDALGLKDLGISWGPYEENAVCNYGGTSKHPEDGSSPFIIKAKVAKKNIDWIGTFAENITYTPNGWVPGGGDEQEVRLKKRVPLSITSYKEEDGDWVDIKLKGRS